MTFAEFNAHVVIPLPKQYHHMTLICIKVDKVVAQQYTLQTPESTGIFGTCYNVQRVLVC